MRLTPPPVQWAKTAVCTDRDRDVKLPILLHLESKLRTCRATTQHHKCPHGRKISEFIFYISFSYSPSFFFLVLLHCQVVITAFIYEPSTPVFLDSLLMFKYLLENIKRRYCSSLIHNLIQNTRLNSLLR